MPDIMTDLLDTFVLSLDDGTLCFVRGYPLAWAVRGDSFNFAIHMSHNGPSVGDGRWFVSHKETGAYVAKFITSKTEYADLLLLAWEALESMKVLRGEERIYSALRKVTPR